MKEGMEKGLEKGLEKGMKEGKKEGMREERIKNARGMKAEGIADEIIARVTGRKWLLSSSVDVTINPGADTESVPGFFCIKL